MSEKLENRGDQKNYFVPIQDATWFTDYRGAADYEGAKFIGIRAAPAPVYLHGYRNFEGFVKMIFRMCYMSPMDIGSIYLSHPIDRLTGNPKLGKKPGKRSEFHKTFEKKTENLSCYTVRDNMASFQFF